MSALDDELDAELRRLFGDERLAVPAKADAPQAVVAAARRIRRKRAVMTSVTGAAMAVLLVAGGLTLGPFRTQDDVAALSSKTLETGTASEALSGPSSSVAPSSLSTTVYAAPPPSPPQAVTTVRGNEETPPRKVVPNKPIPTSSASKFVSAGPQLGPDGFGKLKLGMTEQAASSQGVTLLKTDSTDACAYYEITGAGVPSAVTAAISNSHGLVTIEPSSAAHTPEGIGTGSTKDEVLKKYPATVDNSSGTFSPAGKESTYQFDFDAGGQVQRVILDSVNQDCAG